MLRIRSRLVRHFINRLSISKSGRSQSHWRSTATNVEQFESRNLLSAVLPAYVNGEFTFGDAEQDAPYGIENTFALESNPDATKTIYLDFDGHHSVNNVWGHDIVFPAFNRQGDAESFTTAELIEIQKQFQNVAEDFLPFDVNVTTIDPGEDALKKSGTGDFEWGIRAVNTQATDGFGNGIGGVAYLNSFSWDSDTPVFTFNKGARNGGMTNSHEVGHALGLRHDGLNGSAYHPGTGSGPTAWGPIMGAPFGDRVTQWSNGDYEGSTSTQDDLAIIANSRNGFGYRDDDHGNSAELASSLLVVEDEGLSGWGIVGDTSDSDWFSFQTGSGTVDLQIEAFGQDPNLDIEATLQDADGNVIATSNPLDDTNAAFNLNLDAGTYFLSVDGVGRDGRYSDYGSLGFFSITGTRSDPGVVVGEAGQIDDLNHEWQTVELQNTYQNAAVVFGSLSYNGSHESTVRVRNVTSTSFDVRIQEWLYLDGNHTLESVGYVVVESGVHTLDDGTVIAAGVDTSVNHGWKEIDFGHGFDNAPVVLSQATTFAGSDTIVTRQRSISSTGFSVRLQEEEARGSHVNENLSWIAIESASGQTGDSVYDVLRTSDSVTHRASTINFASDFSQTPVVVAAMQTTDGGDTANLRHRNLTTDGLQLWVDEEKSKDSEVRHTTEVVGLLAIEAGNLIGNSAGAAPTGGSGGSEGGFGDGASDGDGTSGVPVPTTTFIPTDGTLGEDLALPSGHASHDHEDEDHHCDDDHTEEDHDDEHHHHADEHGEEDHDHDSVCDDTTSMVNVDVNRDDSEFLIDAFSQLADSNQLLLPDSVDSIQDSPSSSNEPSRSWLDLIAAS